MAEGTAQIAATEKQGTGRFAGVVEQGQFLESRDRHNITSKREHIHDITKYCSCQHINTIYSVNLMYKFKLIFC